MPDKNDPTRRRAMPVPHPRHKSKPKFEIPAEAGSSEAPVGWVYREEEAAAPVPIKVATTAAAPVASVAPVLTIVPRLAEDSATHHPLVIVGVGMVFIGVGSVGVVSLAALETIAIPIRMARGFVRAFSG